MWLQTGKLMPVSDILPIVFSALESPTPSLVDAALRSIPTVLPLLDFSTIKNELFPVIAAIFSRTNSLAIKVRGLQAFVTLCGGSNDPDGDDGLDGLAPQKKATSSTALDKYTMQEKIVPLIKAIKTKEPAVMMAALNVLRVVGKVADADFVAIDILPILWTMSLGPLLDLKQFQAFMELIKSLSSRVEEEQTKKLQELSGAQPSPAVKDDFMSFGAIGGPSPDANGTSETDFEQLVKGRSSGASGNPMDSGWDTMASNSTVTSPPINAKASTPTATFSWSTPPAASTTSHLGAVKAQQSGGFRTVTPDLANFQALAPTTTQFSQPLQPTPKTTSSSTMSPTAPQTAAATTSVNWGAAASSTSTSLWSSASPAASQPPPAPAFGSLSLNQQQQQSQTPSFSLPPPPGVGAGGGTPSGLSGFSLAPPPSSPQTQTQPQRRPQQLQGAASFSGFGGSGGMGSSLSSLSSLASNNTGTGIAGSGSGSGMGMGMGMATAVKSMNVANGGTSGMSMNSMIGMSTAMGGMGQQQQGQSQGLGQGQKSGLDKYESLL